MTWLRSYQSHANNNSGDSIIGVEETKKGGYVLCDPEQLQAVLLKEYRMTGKGKARG